MESETTMALAWLSPREWRELLEESGFTVEACYGWFDRSPHEGREVLKGIKAVTQIGKVPLTWI